MDRTQGGILVVAGPSGSGKSTLLKRLLAEQDGFRFAVSCTTRPPRKGELHGREYYFVSQEEFEQKIAAGAFAEWEALHARHYGTLLSELDRIRAEGRTAVLDVDVKGALSMRARLPEALLVFIAPPSLEVLEQRLRQRRSESEEQIQIRLARSREEMEQAHRFDCQIVNDDLNDSYQAFLDCLMEFLDWSGHEGDVHAQDA